MSIRCARFQRVARLYLDSSLGLDLEPYPVKTSMSRTVQENPGSNFGAAASENREGPDSYAQERACGTPCPTDPRTRARSNRNGAKS